MRVRRIGSLVVVATLVTLPVAKAAQSGPTPYPGGTWQPERATYGVHVDSTVMVPMDDGVDIRVQVMHPTDSDGRLAAGPFPVLLTQTPYSANLEATGNLPTCDDNFAKTGAPDECDGDYFVRRGYIVLVADQRGTGLSGGGQWGFMDARQGQDGAELAEWAADPKNVTGSAGVVGLFGCSALGISQLTTAAALGRQFASDPAADPVKAMLPGCVAESIYRDEYVDNGVPTATGVASTADMVTDGPRIAVTAAQGGQPQLFGPSMFTGGDLGYERAYWKAHRWVDLVPQIVQSQIPALVYVSWGEGYAGDFNIYTGLQNTFAKRDPLAPMVPGQPTTGRYQFFVGRGSHGCCLGDPGVQLQWFDHWLKSLDTGLDLNTRTPMHLQMNGDGDFYTNAATYPFTSADQVLRLGAGSLGGSPVDGTDSLVWAPQQDGVSSHSYDMPTLPAGGTVAGPVAATIYASSTTSNLQLAATLFDVDPSGNAVEISHGSLLGSLSNLDPARSWTNSKGVMIRPYPRLDWDDYRTADTVQRYDVNMYPALYRVAPGHHLRFTLASRLSNQTCTSAAGIIGIPYGCYYTEPQLQSLAGGMYTVERTTRYPSALNLPLLSYDAFSPAQSGTTPTSGGTVIPQDWGR